MNAFRKNKAILIVIVITGFIYFQACINSNDQTLSQSIAQSDISSKKKDTTDSSSTIENTYQNQSEFLYAAIEPDFPYNDESRFIDADYYNINISPQGTYDDVKNKLKQKREKFKHELLNAENNEAKQKIINEARDYLTESLINKIFPFWYGMPWSLSGYSEIPNIGEVGCSYFVSNTLKHAGFKVNRYKLAQQNTKNIALSIQISDSILILDGNNDINTVKKFFLKNKKEGLYYVGLDCHVGYLLFRKKELFFIQSNYSYPVIVLAEFSEKSEVFPSNKYYIADISWNYRLIEKWINNEEIIVIK